MSDSDLMFRSASELAGMVRSGEVSARELVECSLQRIEELTPTLNAFVDVDAERALATADRIGSGDGRPFAGVFSFGSASANDCFIPFSGTRSCGRVGPAMLGSTVARSSSSVSVYAASGVFASWNSPCSL